MTAAIALYAMGIAGLVSVAAGIIERLCALRAWPRRGVWCAALVLSWAYPIATIWVNQTASAAPEPVKASGTPSESPPEQPTQFQLILPDSAHRRWRVSDFDDAVPVIWVLSSAGLIALFGLATHALRRRSRDWRWHQVDGHIVLITESEGPAVMGFFSPEILFPTWLLEASSRTRAMVLAHEQQHIAARDPLLLLGAFFLLTLAPWNVPLWWQLRRLRFAIEVDCDGRAAGAAKKIVPYAEALLAVSRRRPAIGFGPALALTTRRSQLERRIRILTAAPDRRLTPSVLAFVAALALLASFSQWRAPHLSLDLWPRAEPLPFKPEPTSADSEISALYSRDIPEVLVRGIRNATPRQLWFERQRLADVAAEFNRYNRAKLVIADPTIADLRLGGGFETDDVDAFVEALERTFGLRRLPRLDGDKKRNEILLVGAEVYAAQQAADRERNFDIPSETFVTSLGEFATQSGMAILYEPPPPELARYQTEPVRGRMSPAAALEHLLRGTGCDFERTRPSTTTILCRQKPILQPLDIAPVLSEVTGSPAEFNSHWGSDQLTLRGFGAGSTLVLVNGHRPRLSSLPRDSVLSFRTPPLIMTDVSYQLLPAPALR